MNEMDVQYYHVVSESIDLKITPGDQRKWIGVSGHNIPVLSSLSPRLARHGRDVFCQPAVLQKRKLCGGRPPHFENGNVTEIKAEKGESFTKSNWKWTKGLSGG